MMHLIDPNPVPSAAERTRTPILTATGLSQTYGEGDDRVTALDDVSIELFPGEFALIMGPTGSGKTTLLAVLSGLLRPASGRVIALGQNLCTLSDRDRERFRLKNCGLIFQEYNLMPSLNARQQLELMLCWGQGVTAHEARLRADSMLASLDLSRKGDLMPLQLSGGEQQRVAIGRGLIKNPALCFADEPTAALDWKHGEQIITLLRRAARDFGTSVFVAAHDERIARYADRVYVMEEGRLRQGDRTPVPETQSLSMASM